MSAQSMREMWEEVQDFGLWKIAGLLVFSTVGSFLISDCAGGHRTGPVDCRVSSHGYQPEYTTYDTRCLIRDSDGLCTSTIVVPVTHPPQWWLNIEAQGEYIRIDVDPLTWQRRADGSAAKMSCRRGKWSRICWAPRLES